MSGALVLQYFALCKAARAQCAFANGRRTAKRWEARAARRDFLQKLEFDYHNGFDAYFGNQCADTEYPDTFGEFLATDRFARAGSRFGPYWWRFNNGCAEWPVAADRYVDPWTARTSAPVLVVGNRCAPGVALPPDWLLRPEPTD